MRLAKEIRLTVVIHQLNGATPSEPKPHDGQVQVRGVLLVIC